MFELARLCGDGAYATWAEQLREGEQQVDGEDEEFAHGANAIMIVCTRKTAPHRRIPPYYEFAARRLNNKAKVTMKKSLGLPHLPHHGNLALSCTWQTTRAKARPRFLLTNLSFD
jgi:hypothetical protein